MPPQLDVGGSGGALPPQLDLSSFFFSVVFRDENVGDAAHAMSPQLGTGTSLALADAWTLAHTLRAHARLQDALAAYEHHRAAHLRWYQWWTRLMMPVFQSRLVPLAWRKLWLLTALGGA